MRWKRSFEENDETRNFCRFAEYVKMQHIETKTINAISSNCLVHIETFVDLRILEIKFGWNKVHHRV